MQRPVCLPRLTLDDYLEALRRLSPAVAGLFFARCPDLLVTDAFIGGLTLGGGIGHLTRQCGLTIDNLLGVDMVLADGRFVTANAKENSERAQPDCPLSAVSGHKRRRGAAPCPPDRQIGFASTAH